MQSILDCVWLNRDFGDGRFGTGREEIVMGGILIFKELGHRALTQVHLEHDALQDHNESFCPRQSLNNQLRESVKIFKLDFRPRHSSLDHLMEFFDTGNGKSYSSMQQTCFSRAKGYTYDEICPNGRFHGTYWGCSKLQ